MPLSSVSSGMVTCFSTSSAARPGYNEMTVTCTSDTSGNASMGNCLNATMPPAMNRTANSEVNRGCASANETILFIILQSISEFLAGRQLELEQAHSVVEMGLIVSDAGLIVSPLSVRQLQ